MPPIIQFGLELKDDYLMHYPHLWWHSDRILDLPQIDALVNLWMTFVTTLTRRFEVKVV